VQLTPRYDGPDLLRWEVPLGNPAVPLLRQRERLAGVLHGLDASQWAAPSRCQGWTVQDVITHLVGTNQFWAISIAAGRQGAPTQYLATFDPVATPEHMVDAVRDQSAVDILAGFVESNTAIADALAGTSDAEWLAPAEAPPGHVPLCALVAHALWDSWIHERDVVVPLGLEPVAEPDELALCLKYAAALSPMFLASLGSTRTGALIVDAVDPDVGFVVDIGSTVVVRSGASPVEAARLTGDAAELIEGLSFRRSLAPGVAPAEAWMFGGLAEVFDVAHPVPASISRAQREKPGVRTRRTD